MSTKHKSFHGEKKKKEEVDSAVLTQPWLDLLTVGGLSTLSLSKKSDRPWLVDATVACKYPASCRPFVLDVVAAGRVKASLPADLCLRFFIRVNCKRCTKSASINGRDLFYLPLFIAGLCYVTVYSHSEEREVRRGSAFVYRLMECPP